MRVTMRLSRLSILYSILVGLLLLLLLAPRPTQAQEASLTPLQSSVGAGQHIKFEGAGFKRRERIAIWATDPQGGVVNDDYAHADGDGEIRFEFEVPDNALGGTWTITARGDQSKRLADTTFYVYGRAAQPEKDDDDDEDEEHFQAKVAPLAGPPGTTFAFAAQGFWDERVSYWVTDPNGEVYESHHRARHTTDGGRVDFTWTAPFDAQLGRWVMTIQGYKSAVARGVAFEIIPHQGQLQPPAPPTEEELPSSPDTTPARSSEPFSPLGDPVVESGSFLADVLGN